MIKNENQKKMTIQEFWESDKKLGVVCKTEEQANVFCKMSHFLGKKWMSKASYLDCDYFSSLSKGIIYFNNNTYEDGKFESLMAKKYNWLIYDFDEIDFNIVLSKEKKVLEEKEYALLLNPSEIYQMHTYLEWFNYDKIKDVLKKKDIFAFDHLEEIKPLFEKYGTEKIEKYILEIFKLISYEVND